MEQNSQKPTANTQQPQHAFGNWLLENEKLPKLRDMA